MKEFCLVPKSVVDRHLISKTSEHVAISDDDNRKLALEAQSKKKSKPKETATRVNESMTRGNTPARNGCGRVRCGARASTSDAGPCAGGRGGGRGRRGATEPGKPSSVSHRISKIRKKRRKEKNCNHDAMTVPLPTGVLQRMPTNYTPSK